MKPSTSLSPSSRWDQDYLFTMIAELAKMARRFGEAPVAIHLEALVTIRRLEQRSDPKSRKGPPPLRQAVTSATSQPDTAASWACDGS